jgi:RNA polymerase sigma factor (sigma-70 family)
MTDSPTDLELARAWKAGDSSAADALFERYYEPVARFFCNKAGDAADDLVQRTFLACVEGIGRLQSPASFRSYLFGVAYRLLCRHWRERGREQGRVDLETVAVHDLDPSPSRVLVQRGEQRLVLEALRRLPINAQVVLELHYWEGLGGAEIAEVLEIPLGTAKTWILRGKKALADRLGRIEADGELLHSTLTDLEGWARGLRARAGLGEPSGGGAS